MIPVADAFCVGIVGVRVLFGTICQVHRRVGNLLPTILLIQNRA